MESVWWFYGRKDKKSILAHQPIISALYDLETDIFYSFLTRLYGKVEDFTDEDNDFKTKNNIMGISSTPNARTSMWPE